MTPGVSLLLVLLLQALGEGPALENGYVRVSRDAAPCASANVPGCGDRVIVALGVVELRSGSSRRILKRGDIAVFAAGASYEPPKGAFFEVVIKPNHPAVESPGKIIPPEKNAVLFDGKEFFVFEERLGVGDTRARHSHNQRVVIQLNRTRLQQWPEGQSEIVRDIEPDRPTFNPPVIHTVKNVGDLPLRGIVIEFKTSKAADPSVQYRSPAGVEYRAQLDTGAIARAEGALAADPRNVERMIQLGVAQSGVRQFREAIETFTRGLAIAPNNALLYRWRGHRYLSLRDFDRAMDDLTHGARLDSTNYGIWYHLGIVRFARGDFAGAVDAFARGQPRAPDAGELAGATDWLWMSLMRAGRSADARAMLARRPDSLPTTNAYARRLKLYRGEISPDSVFTPADTADVQVATLSYGVGNWYLVRGDTSSARAWFDRSVRSGGLARLRIHHIRNRVATVAVTSPAARIDNQPRLSFLRSG